MTSSSLPGMVSQTCDMLAANLGAAPRRVRRHRSRPAVSAGGTAEVSGTRHHDRCMHLTIKPARPTFPRCPPAARRLSTWCSTVKPRARTVAVGERPRAGQACPPGRYHSVPATPGASPTSWSSRRCLRAGSRPAGAAGTVSERGSLGQASASCAAGAGEGITPGAAGWVTLRLAPPLRAHLQPARALRQGHAHRTRRPVAATRWSRRQVPLIRRLPGGGPAGECGCAARAACPRPACSPSTASSSSRPIHPHRNAGWR